jgi:hypothetical protein
MSDARAIAPWEMIRSDLRILGLALRAGFEGWNTRSLLQEGHPMCAHWVSLGIEGVTTGVLIILALQVIEALREQPRPHGG